MSEPSESTILIRPARADDRVAILAFSRQTWSWGDYLEYVWDDWLTSPDGRLLVGEIEGQPIAVGRASLTAPGQGWLEGLRVDPRVRRSGVGGTMTTSTLAAARELGATVVRFATRADAYPVHRIAERLGFAKVASYRVLAAPALDDLGPTLERLHGGDESSAWLSLSAAPVPLTWRGWTCRTLDRGELERRLVAGEAFGWRAEGVGERDLSAIAFAVPEVEVSELVIDLLAAQDVGSLRDLGVGLRRLAAERGLERVDARVLDAPALVGALQEVGYSTPVEGDVPFLIFEWRDVSSG